jgi:hypothetical protein
MIVNLPSIVKTDDGVVAYANFMFDLLTIQKKTHKEVEKIMTDLGCIITDDSLNS